MSITMRASPPAASPAAAGTLGQGVGRGRAETAFCWLAVGLIAAWLVAQLTFAASLPLFSESWSELEICARQNPIEALQPTNLPFRPLNHLFFWSAANLLGADPDPLLMRLPTALLHAASVLVVWRIARQVGVARTGAAVAALLFAAFPATKELVWAAAVTSAGRVTAMLWTLSLFLAWQRGRRAAGAGMVAAHCVGLLFHQTAIVTPALLLLWAAVHAASERHQSPTLATLFGSALRLWRRVPFVLVCLASAGAVALVLLWPDTHTGIRQLGALAANVVKATFALLPEALRLAVADGFRGAHGTSGLVLASLATVVVWSTAALVLWRGSALARFAVLAMVVDLAPPVLKTGFSQRYAELAAAFVAIAVGAFVVGSGARRPVRSSPVAAAVAVLLAAGWLWDSARYMGAYAEAGTVVRQLLADVATVRSRVGPEQRIVVADLPDVWNREKDLPIFNWGFRRALRSRCDDPEPLTLWRTRPYATGSDVDLVTSAALEGLRSDPTAVLLEYDAARRRLVGHVRGEPWPPAR